MTAAKQALNNSQALNNNDDPNFRVTNNNAIDVHVGRRIRLRRTLLGMSQEKIGRGSQYYLSTGSEV